MTDADVLAYALQTLQELYEFALKIFATRVQTARLAAHLSAPARYACTNPDCGAHINERLNDESPLFAYRNAAAKPWHMLCQRSCAPMETAASP